MNAEHIVFLTEWAARWGAHLQIAGTVGIGRECVGIAQDSSYIDYSELTSQAGFWTPEDAYHKHDCLAVLGRGDDAILHLRVQVQRANAGWSVEPSADGRHLIGSGSPTFRETIIETHGPYAETMVSPATTAG